MSPRVGTTAEKENVSTQWYEWKGRLTDVVEFFQSPLLNSREEEDEDERGDVESAV